MTRQKLMGLVASLVVLGALSLLPAFAQPTTTSPDMTGPVKGQVVFTITNTGITGGPSTAEGGLYIVTVRNESRGSRGLVIRGVDLCCSPYVRFTKVLKPGREVTFRWYFPENRTVEIRDLLQCKPISTTCGYPKYGRLTTQVVFA